jgi:hypothetical protein
MSSASLASAQKIIDLSSGKMITENKEQQITDKKTYRVG